MRRPLAAYVRRFYWRHVRRYRYEVCGSVKGGPAHAAIRGQGCGRPVGLVWRAPTAIWNYVTTGQDQTVYTVREGAAGGPIMERAEGAGGILCLACFDRLARETGVHVRWETRPL